MTTTTIPRSVPQEFHDRIAYWDDERSEGNGLIVSLKYGWQFADLGTGGHTDGFENVRQAVREIKQMVPCNCEECQYRR